MILRRTVRFLTPKEVGPSLEIIAEAADLMTRFGEHAWMVDESFAADHAQAAEAGELVGGFAGGVLECTMRLEALDPVYWPEAGRGEALYIHKLAVRRAAAKNGWPAELIRFAMSCARDRGVPELRLDTLDREPLISLYATLGFVLAGPAVGHNGLVLMRMSIPAALP